MFRHPPKAADYRVTLNLFDKRAEKTDMKLEYQMHFTLLNKTLRKKNIVRLQRDNINLNDSNIHDPLSEISLISGEVLNDLELEITENGDITRIKNLKEINKRWKEDIRFRLEHTYKGGVVDNILSHMDKQIDDEPMFIRSLQKDPFFYFYIKALSGKETDIPIHWIAGIPITFERELENDEENGTIKLILKDKEKESSKLEEYYSKLYGKGNIKTYTDISYSIENNFIKSLYVLLKIYWNDVPVKKLDMEVELL